MSALEHIANGAPGVYTLAPQPLHRLRGVRLDACAFVGVAPRGPCRVPRVDATAGQPDDWSQCAPARARRRSVAVRVDSFDAYRRLYGGFEGPGLLPYAVASFFEQGGREAWVVRIVHAYGNAALDGGGVARGALRGVSGAALLHARNEGAWGNGLVATLGFTVAALALQAPAGLGSLALGRGQPVTAGTLLRLRLEDGRHVLRFVSGVQAVGDAAQPRRWLQATLESPAPAKILGAEVVEATLALEDGQGGREGFGALGLHVAHPRWLGTVLCRESQLVWPDIAWAGDRLVPADPLRLAAVWRSESFQDGEDRYAAIVHGDFFEPGWTPLDDEVPPSGLQAVVGEPAVTQLVLPDLYQPQPLPPQGEVRDVSVAGAGFAPCVKLPVAAPTPANTSALPGLALDPRDPLQLETITGLLLQVQGFVEATREHVALLDVPPGLQARQVLALRSRFDSAFCALYHPWLAVARSDDAREGLVALPPSAAAAGIVAATELAWGVPHGPANRIVQGALRPQAAVSPAEHGELHRQGVNVFLQESAGVRLTAARTLALDPQWRQLSVRRLLLLLRRTLLQQMQWAVFEPHTPALRREIVHLCTGLLRRLYRQGAFSGASEEEAFFVRCDDALNPPYLVDNGQLLAHIGVAPAEPLEFIVLQLARAGDGTLTLENA